MPDQRDEIKFLGQPLDDLHVRAGRPTDKRSSESPEFEVEALDLEAPSASPQVRLQLELRTGLKLQVSLHRPDADSPVSARIIGEIPGNLTIRELRALSLLLEESADAGSEL